MVEKEARVKSKYGLHARPSSRISSYAACHPKTSITLSSTTDEGVKVTADGRSLMEILLMERLPGDIVIVRAEGEDEETVASDIAKIIDEFEAD